MTPSSAIGEFASLSIIELLTLQRLTQHHEPVVRYILYQEVNQILNPKIKNHLTGQDIFEDALKPSSLSTSSFYNSLRTLEKKELVSFKFTKESDKGSKKKIEAVEATEKAREALESVMSYFLYSMIDDLEYLKKLAEELLKRVGKVHFPTILTVSLIEEVDLNLLRFFSSLTDQLFMLSKENVFENLTKLGFEKLHHTTMINNVIREPDNIFDVSVVPGYEREPDFYGLTRIDLLKQLKRVTIKEGFVILVVRSEMPEVANFYARELLKAFSFAVEGRIFTKEELEADLKAAEFKKFETFEFHGLIVGIGYC